MARLASYLIVITLLGGSLIYAQQKPAQPASSPNAFPAKPVEPKETAPTNSDRWCDIYFHEESLQDVIVLDNNGKYLANVGEVYIWIRAGVQKPLAKLFMWNGRYKPSEAAIKNEVWVVRSLKVINKNEFQTMIDKEANQPQ